MGGGGGQCCMQAEATLFRFVLRNMFTFYQCKIILEAIELMNFLHLVKF